MESVLSIKSIIELIPTLLEYFIPGFIFLGMRNFFLGKDITKDSYFVLKSVVISFVLTELIKSVTNLIITLYKPSELFLANEITQRSIVLIITIAISYLYINKDWEKKLLDKFGKGKTSNNDYISTLVDNNKGAWIRVYLKEDEIIYVGKLHYHDSRDRYEDGCIVLSAFIAYDYDANELENNSLDDSKEAIVYYKKINRMEIIQV